ncbi:hypothetical protein LWI29_021823 [Acer saccharum]|uniref:Uncharacterized protein n=1 Tax=Acer saccharum TaxID=4024 RepID=A0AA39SUK6_ACESA|nr:hypothetical protein LWI29_021823 [Acer saccharum]
MYRKRLMKYFSPLSLYDYALKCGGNVMFTDVGTKKSVVSCIDNTCITFSKWLAKEDYLELRQEVNDLLEYSNAKLDRVTRYLGVLAEKTCKIKLPLKPKLEYLH